MIHLNSPIWKELSSACRKADQLLRRLMAGEGDFHENMEGLAEDLGHQLSFYHATAYVLPHLADLCPKLSLEDRIFLIAQMGAAIAAEAEEPLLPGTEPYREFEEGLNGLRRETRNIVTDPSMAVLLSGNLELCQQFALSALAVCGDRRHAFDFYLLSAYNWKEGAAACSCGWNEEALPLAGEPGCIEPAVIAPWDGNSLDNEPVWLQGLLKLAGDEDITPVLPLLYGTCTCPNCGKREPYWSWLERFMTDY